jgi:hypothetical protein
MTHDRPLPARAASADDDFDRVLRARHHDAVDSLSPRVQAQLRQRLRALHAPVATARLRHPAWGLALGCSLALVLALGIHRRAANEAPAVSTTAPATAGNNDNGELVATLDEAPDLYLWLASDDANSILRSTP